MDGDDTGQGFDLYARTAALLAKSAEELVEKARATHACDAAYELIGHETAYAILLGQAVVDAIDTARAGGG